MREYSERNNRDSNAKIKEAKIMATKRTGGTKAKNIVKVTDRVEERRKFFETQAKRIGETWKAMGDKASSMGVAAKLKLPSRLVDYCTVRLELRKSSDKGLKAWVDADERPAPVQVISKPKAKKLPNGDVLEAVNGAAQKGMKS